MVQAAAITRGWRAASARPGPWSDDLGSPSVKAGLWLALGLWLLIVVLSAPGQAWSAAQEAWCYWIPSILDPYRQSDWTSPVAYVYSPAFLEVIAPLRALSWTAFVAVWTALLLGAVTYLTGLRLLWLGVLVAAAELYGGNISLFLAVAIVLGFRWPATWAFVILTKVTPGIGLLWFAVRREWRNLGIALAATAVVAGASAVAMPLAWQQWVHVLMANAGRDGTWAAVPIALVGAVADGRRPRGLGGQDRPALDGPGRIDAGVARALVRQPQHAPGGDRRRADVGAGRISRRSCGPRRRSGSYSRGSRSGHPPTDLVRPSSSPPQMPSSLI